MEAIGKLLGIETWLDEVRRMTKRQVCFHVVNKILTLLAFAAGVELRNDYLFCANDLERSYGRDGQ